MLRVTSTMSCDSAVASILASRRAWDTLNKSSRKRLIKHGFSHREYRDFDGLPGEILDLRLSRT